MKVLPISSIKFGWKDTSGLLSTLTTITATYPFDHIAINLFGPLPVDEHGFSSVIIIQLDNGTEFVNTVLTTFKNLAGFDHCFISSYHPQANGAAESHVKLAKSLLLKLFNKYNNKIADSFNKKAPLVSFAPSDTVILVNSGANAKTDPKYLGPFRVIEHIYHDAYCLDDLTSQPVPDTVSPSLLKKVDLLKLLFSPSSSLDSADLALKRYEVYFIVNYHGSVCNCEYLVC
ncbi:Integrase catalytic domain-containing protein [Balamuthia mandrillaris]